MAIDNTSRSNAAKAFASVPEGHELGRFANYLEAKKVVELLLDGGISPKALSIVGDQVSSVERITARYGYGRAAASSAITGSWVGLFSGLLFVSFGTSVSLTPLFAGAVIGAGVGMIIGMVLYTAGAGNRPRYRSINQLIAQSYRVIVDDALQGKAKRVLGESEGPGRV